MGSVLGGGHVVFLGDSHGNASYVVDGIAAAADNDVRTIIQVGDFGVWPGFKGEAFLKAVDDAVGEYGVDFFFIDGNHEDFVQLEDAYVNNCRHSSGAVYLTEHILWLPRGTVTDFGGRRFAFLGGSVSVDRGRRTKFVSWWPQEAIGEGDLRVLEGSVGGGGVDVLVTHDVPGSVCLPFEPGGDWPGGVLVEAERQRLFLDEAVLVTRPELVVHGHWHMKYGSVGVVGGHSYRVQGYGMEGVEGIGVLDLESLVVDPPFLFDAVVGSFCDFQLRRFG